MNEKNEERLNSFGQITDSEISLYDSNMEVKYVIKGLNIRGAIQMHEKYLYAISDQIKDPVSITTFNDEEEEDEKDMQSAVGFYVYNTD